MGSVLADARKAAGLTQAELAAAADLNRSTIIDLEKGTTGIDINSLFEIAKAVNTPLSRLIAAVEADEVAGPTLRTDD